MASVGTVGEEPMAEAGDEATRAATGRVAAEWFALLDDAGAREATHQEIVRLLEQEGVDRGWWRQQVTVEYERHIGRRIEGQTQDAGFQVGVRRTFPIERGELWERLLSDLLETWLPGATTFPAAAGDTVPFGGGSLELRSVAPERRIRTWLLDADGERTSILQLYLDDAATGTTLGFHEEQLASQEQREQRRAHWRAVADAIATRI